MPQEVALRFWYAAKLLGHGVEIREQPQLPPSCGGVRRLQNRVQPLTVEIA